MNTLYKIFRNTLTFLLVISLSGCSGKDNPEPDGNEPPAGDTNRVQIYLTRGDQTKLFCKEAGLVFRKDAPTGYPIIVVDTAQRFQEMEGFGAALTGSSAYLINKRLDGNARTNLLNELFYPDKGIGLSYLRLTMGASDFSLSDFTYDDMPAGETDFNLDHFSLSQDKEDVLPVLKQIIQIAPDIPLLGSPWSPPAWMKTNGSLKGGKLKPECYAVYSDYFVKYIQAMKAEGLTIDAVTIQNEPLHFTANYPCMEMQAEEQLDFIKNYLGPKFVAAGLDTKIITYDHNWDKPEYPMTILDDAAARQYVAGSAFHAYAGDVSAMTVVHNAHPDKALYFTEISGGAWATDFAGNLMWNMRNIFIGTTRNWSKNALLWNLALNENYGPQNNGCNNCRGVITINSVTGAVIKNVEYYALAHFSKFVRPGAVRVSTEVPGIAGETGAVAFQNSDGSKVMIIANYAGEMKSYTVKQQGKIFIATVPPTSVVTLVWK
ncbi:MAG: glycoside hydrolase family 30 beta sandwich domain-containing protein [Lentimicrobium sp.]|jgi:glucosylceramidase|nr:glycoside hydrolase family 30 beta sandwich domain-containing protein [Lentimicrobium sp.]